MKRLLSYIVSIILLSVIILSDSTLCIAGSVSMKPQLYARDDHGAYTHNISPTVKAMAKKVHKAIRKNNNPHYWAKASSISDLRAMLAYMSEVYLNYQCKEEYPYWSDTFKGTIGKFKVDLNPKYYRKLRKKDKYVRGIVKTAIKSMSINTLMSEVEAINRVNDWICNKVNYDWSGYNGNTNVHWNAYQALTTGTCVCEGYADLFQIFMSEIGIRAYRVESDPLHHIWNAVVIDGVTEYIDVCWNDNSTSQSWLLLQHFTDHGPEAEYQSIEDTFHVSFQAKRVFYNNKKGY